MQTGVTVIVEQTGWFTIHGLNHALFQISGRIKKL